MLSSSISCLMPSTKNESLLRRSLLANALFTMGCGFVLVFASGTVAALMGAVGATELIITGVILLLYAADLARTAHGKRLPRRRVYYFIGMDLLWVIGSAVVLWGLAVPFTGAGRWIILLVADAVGLFGLLQYLGLRRFTRPLAETLHATSLREDEINP